MGKYYYVMHIGKFKPVADEVIHRHVEHLKKLDAEGRLIVCGPINKLEGVAGMVVFKAKSKAEAEAYCQAEPLVAEGHSTYTLHTLTVADKSNNFLLG
jgi:uncharacterized protein YciI